MREINIKLIIFMYFVKLVHATRLNGYPNLNITAMVCLHAQDSIHRWKWARLVTFLSLNYVQNVLSKVNLIYISRSRNILLCDSKQLTLFKHACARTYVCVWVYIWLRFRGCPWLRWSNLGPTKIPADWTAASYYDYVNNDTVWIVCKNWI